MAERGAVTGGDLVGHGAQTLMCQPPHEGGGEEVVVLAQDELGGHVRPRIEWPWRVPDRRGFPAPAPAQGFFGQRARYAVVESDERIVVAGHAAVEPGLLFSGLLVTGVGPPFAGGLAGDGDHPG